MSTYAIIETGGQQLRVETRRFYNINKLTSLKSKNIKSFTEILIYTVLMICQEASINIGHPWVKNAIVNGRILHNCLEKKLTIYKMV